MAERLILNFLMHLSGIASLTADITRSGANPSSQRSALSQVSSG